MEGERSVKQCAFDALRGHLDFLCNVANPEPAGSVVRHRKLAENCLKWHNCTVNLASLLDDRRYSASCTQSDTRRHPAQHPHLSETTGPLTFQVPCRYANALLGDLDYKLGQILHIVAPTLWVKLTRRACVPGFDGEGHFVRASVIHDICRNCMVPQLTAVRQLAGGRRIIAHMDIIRDKYTVSLGQKVPLLNLDNKLGFKQCTLSPEVQVGVDMRAMVPTVRVLLSDDDYKGYQLNPKHHPLVLLGAAGVYGALMKFRFPISASVDVAKFKGENRVLELQLVTTTKRVDNNPVATTNVTGLVLCMRV